MLPLLLLLLVLSVLSLLLRPQSIATIVTDIGKLTNIKSVPAIYFAASVANRIALALTYAKLGLMPSHSYYSSIFIYHIFQCNDQ